MKRKAITVSITMLNETKRALKKQAQTNHCSLSQQITNLIWKEEIKNKKDGKDEK